MCEIVECYIEIYLRRALHCGDKGLLEHYNCVGANWCPGWHTTSDRVNLVKNVRAKRGKGLHSMLVNTEVWLNKLL